MFTYHEVDYRHQANALIERLSELGIASRLKRFSVSDSIHRTFLFASCSSRWPWVIPALPFCHSEVKVARPGSPSYPNELNMLGDHIKKCRLDRGLLQREVAALLGVHPLTITNWEGNATTPASSSFPAIIEFLGYNPLPDGTIQEQLLAQRRMLGLSQDDMAIRLGVDRSTLHAWETGRRMPSRKGRELIQRAVL